MAHGVPAARHCVPPHPDRHAVRHGAAAAGVTFLHPLALVGLAAAAIPALLHLLERRVPPEAEFPPLRYLSEAERQNARRLKLRHLLLLLLRTTLIVLLVLAAARPLFPTRARSEEHTSELQSRLHLVCRLLLEKKKKNNDHDMTCKEISRV